MPSAEEVYILREYGSSIAEIAKILFPDMELSRAKLKIASLLWKAKRKREKQSSMVEYWEDPGYREEPFYMDRNWQDCYEVTEPDGYADVEKLLALKRRGLLSYEEERYLETKMFLKILYDRYLKEYDHSGLVWRSIVAYNKRVNKEVWKRRPGTKITKRMAAYFYVIVLRVYLDLGYRWLKNALEQIRQDYNVGEGELREMLPLLAKIM